MTTLAVDTWRDIEVGDRSEYPVITTDIIYEGAAVGLVNASGHARPLTNVDRFVGFAEKQADNSTGAAAAINVRVIKKGAVKLAVTGAVITDVGCPVYAQDDNAFSFIKTSGVFIGFLRRYVSAGYGIVEFDANVMVDPHDGLLAESNTTSFTIDAQDAAKAIFIAADAVTVTLPAVEGVGRFRVINAGAFAAQIVTITPDVSDMIEGPNVTGVDGTSWINTKATACRGDYVDIKYGDANGWAVTKKRGIWAYT